MQIRDLVLIGAALIGTALIGQGLGGIVVANGAASPAQLQTADVKIDNFSFGPQEITVAAGTEVTWENRDDIPHTITDAGEPRAFKSGPLDTGEKFSRVFATAGTFHYFCSLHPHMQGTVVVK